MIEFIYEIKTGKRHINPKIVDCLVLTTIMLLALFIATELVGIDLVGYYY